ncbi:MAG: Tetratricopeptide repeat protein [Acidobacteriaceae bacterium]|nr:Tetratricopeptide repeat protein [Acidobacteriaceae bacterium]
MIPFENQSKAPGIEWIGESFPELLQERLNSSTVFVLPREARIHAYDHVGIPVDLHPSRATIYRIAEDMGVDYVVFGRYSFDGRIFSASSQLLDMHHPRLLPEATESGALVDLITAQTSLAWDILHALRPEFSTSKQAYLSAASPIRLDAFENLVRGVMSSTPQEQIRHFREAARLNPSYWEAVLRLGESYYRDRQYDQAESWLARIPVSNIHAQEANFYLGLAAYFKADYGRAESAFTFMASKLPFGEIYNNLGVVASRRGQKEAVQYFQRAVNADPNDADYHFNLAVALYHFGDLAGSSHEVRQALAEHPTDGEASSLLQLTTAETGTTGAVRLPLERIRTNYNESTFRELAIQIDAVAEQRLAKTDPRTHARYHVDRGRELLNQGFVAEADREFREATTLDPTNAFAHSGLARVLEANNDSAGSRLEAQEALRQRQFADPLLVLARLDLSEDKTESAAADIDQALRLEPSNVTAIAMKRTLAAKLAQKAQPLPKP